MPSITISLNKDDKSFDHLSDNDNNTNTTNHNKVYYVYETRFMQKNPTIIF